MMAFTELGVLTLLGLMGAMCWATAWMICNPDQARQIMIDGVRGLLALVRR